MAQTVKNPPAMWDTWVRSLGWENPLEESMATHASILAWRIPQTEETGGLPSVGLQTVGPRTIDLYAAYTCNSLKNASEFQER